MLNKSWASIFRKLNLNEMIPYCRRQRRRRRREMCINWSGDKLRLSNN